MTKRHEFSHTRSVATCNMYCVIHVHLARCHEAPKLNKNVKWRDLT